MNETENWYVLARGETERLSASIPAYLAEKLERQAGSHGEKSFIVAEALTMYLQYGDLARVENKLRLVLAEEQVPHRGPAPESSTEKNSISPAGLSERETQVLNGVVGKSEAQGRPEEARNREKMSLEDGSEEIIVTIPCELRERVYDELSGQRGVGTEVVAPALELYFAHDGWLGRVEEMLDVLLASKDVPVPRPTPWAEQVRNGSDLVETEPFEEALEVSVADVDTTSIEPSDEVQVKESDIEWAEVKRRARYQAGAVLAACRWMLDDGGTVPHSVIEKRIKQFNVVDSTEDRIQDIVNRRLVKEGYTPMLLTEFVQESDWELDAFPQKMEHGWMGKGYEYSHEQLGRTKGRALDMHKEYRESGKDVQTDREAAAAYKEFADWISEEKA